MADLKAQVQTVWKANKPDLVIADFTLPIVGFLAQEMDVCWWTSTSALCAIETNTGTPSYLGGLTPGDSLPLWLRDFLGRKFIRGFKLGIGYWFRNELQSLNIPSIYLDNGYERIYSPAKILGLGMREFEFERDWPPTLEFIGPLTASPPFPHVPPTFEKDVKHVLVSLGTHIPWAKDQAAQFVQQVAAQMPRVHFHFSYGKAAKEANLQLGSNIYYYNYLPYDEYMPHFDAAIIHGGAGVVYSCIKAGVPMLIWPHDYDQFDQAARVVRRKLGLRFKADLNHTVQTLHQLFSDQQIARQMTHFQTLFHQYAPAITVLDSVKELASTLTR